MFMQGTPNPQPGFFLLAAALRLAHSIGLHKRGSDFNLNDVESEQRKRVFWIAYIMDKEYAHQPVDLCEVLLTCRAAFAYDLVDLQYRMMTI